MKATVSKADITAVIQKLQSIVPTKPQVPILANLYVEANKEEQQLVFYASDLKLSMKAEIPAQVDEGGKLLIPTKKFFPLVRELIAPTLTFSTTPSFNITLSSGSSQFKLSGMSSEGFPALPNLSEHQQISFATNVLKELLHKTTFSASKDDKKPVFNSILLQRTNAKTNLTGSDGKRIARAISDAPVSKEWEGSFVLPLKAAEEMLQLLDTKEESIEIDFMEEKLFMQVGPITLISQLLAGSYPDVLRIVPDNYDHSIVLHREELISLLRQVSLFTTADFQSVRFSFTPGDLQLSIAAGGTGEGTVNMPINFQGEPFQIALNPGFFLDILHRSKDETVLFKGKDAYTPCIISDSSSAFFVLMPMRLDA